MKGAVEVDGISVMVDIDALNEWSSILLLDRIGAADARPSEFQELAEAVIGKEQLAKAMDSFRAAHGGRVPAKEWVAFVLSAIAKAKEASETAKN